MTPEDFAKALHEHVVCRNALMYRQLLNETSLDDATDPYWRAVLQLHQSLDAGQQETILRIMRQVSVDAMSSVLAVFDGVTPLSEDDPEFTLRTETSEDALNGDLQDLFLAIEENLEG